MDDFMGILAQEDKLWNDFQFTDTDEDWSVSENSSDPGQLFLDGLDDGGAKIEEWLDFENVKSNKLLELDFPDIRGNLLQIQVEPITSDEELCQTPVLKPVKLNSKGPLSPTERKRKATSDLEDAIVATNCASVKALKRVGKCEVGASITASSADASNVSKSLLSSNSLASVESQASLKTKSLEKSDSFCSKRGGKVDKRCEFCLETFENHDLLQKHRQKHMMGNNHFKCTFPDCKKDYATGEGLRLHVRNVHLCAKNWKCLSDGCDRSFVRQSDLRMHIIRMHSNIRPFPCSVAACNKSFACHSELRRHVLSCHKVSCPKPETSATSKTNYVDPSFIQGLMQKAE